MPTLSRRGIDRIRRINDNGHMVSHTPTPNWPCTRGAFRARENESMSEETKTILSEIESKSGVKFVRCPEMFLNLSLVPDADKLESLVVEASTREIELFDNTEAADAENELIAVIPKMRQNEAKGEPMILERIIVAAVPQLPQFEASDSGKAWIRETLLTAMSQEIKNRLKTDGIIPSELPRTVLDFISTRKAIDLTGWKKHGKDALAQLKKQNASRSVQALTVPTFRDCLESQAIAEANFPKVQPATWERIIQSVAKLCKVAQAEKEHSPMLENPTLLENRSAASHASTEELVCKKRASLEGKSFARVGGTIPPFTAKRGTSINSHPRQI